MKNLQSLTLSTELRRNHNLHNCQTSDFAWIQGSSSSSSSSSTPSVFMSWRSSNSHEQIRKNYVSCLEKIKSQSNRQIQDMKRSIEYLRRAKLQELQERNDFRSDHDRPIPMVDDLEDLSLSGTLQDMEACLQAQIHRFDQDSREIAAARPGAVVVASSRPWPSLQKLVLSCGDWGRFIGSKLMTRKGSCCVFDPTWKFSADIPRIQAWSSTYKIFLNERSTH